MSAGRWSTGQVPWRDGSMSICTSRIMPGTCAPRGPGTCGSPIHRFFRGFVEKPDRAGRIYRVVRGRRHAGADPERERVTGAARSKRVAVKADRGGDPVLEPRGPGAGNRREMAFLHPGGADRRITTDTVDNRDWAYLDRPGGGGQSLC